MKLTRLSHIWLIPLLVAVSALVYWSGLTGGFIFDDHSTIVTNPRVHIDSIEPGALSRAARSFDPGGTLGKRPLAMASFAINHAISGLDPWGFKLTGLLVHLLNTLLIFALTRRLFALVYGNGARSKTIMTGAAAVTLLWAIHPLQISSVLYVVQRMETLSFTFVFLALIAYLHGRQRQMLGQRGWPWLLGCLPLVALGMSAKESAMLFPAFALALELTALDFRSARPTTARLWRWAYGTAVAAAVAVFALKVVPHYWSNDIFGRNFHTAERLLTQLRALPMYLGQIIVPVPRNMTFYYDNFPVSHGLLSPVTTLLGGLLLAAMLLSALVFRRRMPLFALGIFWFFIAHALTSNVVALELVFEHRNYFALFGIVLALADLVRRIPMRDGPALKNAAVVVVVCLFAFLGTLRAAVWGNPLLLATELVSINPGSSRASSDLAAIYLEMTDGYANSPFNDFAIREFERGSLIPGSSIVSDQGLILASAQAGRPIDDIWWQRLIDKVEHGTLSPETTQGLFGLLSNRMRGVELDDDRLIDAFLALFNRATLPPYSYAQFGDYVLTKVGDQPLADQIFALAIERSQKHPDYAAQVIGVLEEQGHSRQAQIARNRASELGLPVPPELVPAPTANDRGGSEGAVDGAE